jgi:hypothetical protein
MYDFKNRATLNQLNTLSLLGLDSHLTSDERNRLQKTSEFWNFYEGYHWEDIQDLGDRPQITENYCRAFVDKFVAFEFGTGFRVKSPFEDNDPETPITDFLTEVWKDNKKNNLCTELGQSKSVSGFGCIQVKFESVGTFDDPFGEYEKGRIRIVNVPSHIVFPRFDPHDKDKINELMIAYPIEVEDKSPVLRTAIKKQVLYKQIWTKNSITIEDGMNKPITIPNKYGIIPFVLVPNFPMSGKPTTEAQSDLEDLIPLNIELNAKTSDVSEIIDYYSAPITILYGAKVSSLEKGANKLWGGLPKDARVQNLELQGDLGASNNYRADLKSAMHEIGGVPEGALGGKQAISNTSSVALHIANSPIIERVRVKRGYTASALEDVNKIILFIAQKEELITKPEKASNKEFYSTEILFPDVLPKDRLLELQQIQIEMNNGLEYRKKAMERLGKEDINDYIQKIDEDVTNNPEFYGQQRKEPELNSGFANSQTPVEQVRQEITGQNGANPQNF